MMLTIAYLRFKNRILIIDLKFILPSRITHNAVSCQRTITFSTSSITLLANSQILDKKFIF